MRDHSMSIVATFAHEWRQQIYSGRTFIFQACLLLALSVAVFLVGGLFDSDFASFDLVWSFLPAIAIVLVPAFGARAFAQEDGSRELELLLTLPLSDSGIVIGKWLSGTAFLALTLCCAAPIAITIGYLGSPDWGAAAAGDVGAVLMLATLLCRRHVLLGCDGRAGFGVCAVGRRADSADRDGLGRRCATHAAAGVRHRYAEASQPEAQLG